MRRRRFTHACLALIALLFCAHARATLDLSSLRLPPGFRIALYAEDLPSARQLALVQGVPLGRLQSILDLVGLDQPLGVDDFLLQRFGLAVEPDRRLLSELGFGVDLLGDVVLGDRVGDDLRLLRTLRLDSDLDEERTPHARGRDLRA